MPETQLRIFFHNRCYDGASSAALFAEFFRRTQNAEATIDYVGMAHSPGDPFAGVSLDAEVNACVDFRYCAEPRMHWWIDHHQSAFQPASLRAHFDDNPSNTKFYDPTARSCAVYAHRVLTEHFQFKLEDPNGHWQELLHWADKIDGAVFDNANEIVELGVPALKLMMWLRSNRSNAKMVKTIEQMGKLSQAQLLELPWIAEEIPALLRDHHHGVAVIKERITMRGSVAVFDLSNDAIESFSGFAAYMHRPEATYSIGLARTSRGPSIAVGRNPWAEDRRNHNIASICEEYGGGGHPQVGGISLPGGQIDRAREIVAEIAARLGAAPNEH